MSASISVMTTENADNVPLCQPIFFGDTRQRFADTIPRMTDTLQDRLKKLIADKGMSVAEAERAIGVSKDTLRKLINTPGQMPSARTLSKLARGFAIAEQWLLDGTAKTEPVEKPTNGAARAPALPEPHMMPNDVPVMGTAAGNHLRGAFQLEGGIIDYVRRPPAQMGARNIYALYVEGTSMVPQFSPGDLIYLNPNKPCRVGDAVVIQSQDNPDDPTVSATLGIYVRTTERHIVIRKHNPAAEVQVLRNPLTKVHRVLTVNEMMGG